jgi:hypothetical protein
MSEAVRVAQMYFVASNKSDMGAIAAMMSRSTTYSSAHTGVYLGVDQIITMQTAFHHSFKTLRWDVRETQEIRPGVVQIDFAFSGEKQNGEVVQYDGEEFVIVLDGKIQHLEIRNKKIGLEVLGTGTEKAG